MIKRWLPLAVLAVIAVVAYVIVTWPSDEEAIRSRLDGVVATLRVDALANDRALRAARVENAFPHLFVVNAVAKIPEAGTSIANREELTAVAIAASEPYTRIEPQLQDVKISVQPGKVRAEAKVIASVTLRKRTEPSRTERRAVTLALEKEDGEWKIAQIAVEPKAER